MTHVGTTPSSPAIDLRPPTAPQPASCLNCGAPLVGPFCAECGQRDVPPYPSVRELAVDAFWELSGWDGRFATTVRALIAHPGRLTREFLEGRRARYISPLRLYLMCSLVYFLGAAMAPDTRVRSAELLGGLQVSGSVASGPSRPERVANAAEEAMDSRQPLSAEQRDQILGDIGRAPALMQPFLRRAVLDPAGFRNGLLQAMPRMLFALLPVFALIVAVFYRGRKYPEHLYFAIHLHAFTFLALTVIQLAKFTRVAPLIGVTAALVLLSLPVYSTLAFRRTYGGSLVGTVAKEAAIGTIYVVVAILGLLTMIYVVSLFG